MALLMRRIALFVVGACLATAEHRTECSVNAARSVDEMLDSAIYVWAAVERCENAGSQVQCEIDVAEAFESVIAMANVIAKAVGECEDLAGDQCGISIGHLAQATAGAAGATGGIVEKCQQTVAHMPAGAGNPPAPGVDSVGIKQMKMAKCLVDFKGTMMSLFLSVQRIMDAKKACKAGEDHCAGEVINIIGAFASVGQYVAGTIGRCGSKNVVSAKTKREMMCANEILALDRHVDSITSVATEMAATCKQSSESRSRLYGFSHTVPVAAATSTSSVTAMLFALLPITAIMGFLGGTRLGKSKQQHEQQQQIDSEHQSDMEPLVEVGH